MIERHVAFSPEAQADALRLYDWLADVAGPEIAIGYIDRLAAFINRLSFASERGHLRSDIRPNLRIIGFERRVTIAFAVELERVLILRLFYGGQN